MVNEELDLAIILGSKSDLPHMNKALDLLATLDLSYEIRVYSAHRSPGALACHLQWCEARGVKIYICLAGKAAHLAGVVASKTDRPVIGVPMPTSMMGGLDSLLSTVQMPSGTPVATMGVGSSGVLNAVLMSLKILALSDESCLLALREYQITQIAEIEKANQDLSE